MEGGGAHNKRVFPRYSRRSWRICFQLLKHQNRPPSNEKRKKCPWFFTNIFTATPITRSFFNIFSIRFFQCIIEVLVHLLCGSKVLYAHSFGRYLKNKYRFWQKKGFFTQLLSRHAFTIHFTDMTFMIISCVIFFGSDGSFEFALSSLLLLLWSKTWFLSRKLHNLI